jgi:hypothetical protein
VLAEDPLLAHPARRGDRAALGQQERAALAKS